MADTVVSQGPGISSLVNSGRLRPGFVSTTEDKKPLHLTQGISNQQHSITLQACPECNVLFARKQSLLKHRVVAHSYVPKYKCDQCSVMLTTQDEIDKHIKKHEKPPAFPCKLCPQKFTAASSLIRHIRYKHTFERPFKCELCDFSCVEYYKLSVHLRSHTGESPYDCNKCGACFKTNVSLRRHSLTHTDIREYICVLCFQQFSIINTLRCHMRTMHMVENLHLDGVRCSTKDGVPKTIAVYLEMMGYTVENALKNMGITNLRFYQIKDEYMSCYTKNFRKVSPLILNMENNDSDSQVSSAKKHKVSSKQLKRTFLGKTEESKRVFETTLKRRTRSSSAKQKQKDTQSAVSVIGIDSTKSTKKRGRQRKTSTRLTKTPVRYAQVLIEDQIYDPENNKTEMLGAVVEEERFYDFEINIDTAEAVNDRENTGRDEDMLDDSIANLNEEECRNSEMNKTYYEGEIDEDDRELDNDETVDPELDKNKTVEEENLAIDNDGIADEDGEDCEGDKDETVDEEDEDGEDCEGDKDETVDEEDEDEITQELDETNCIRLEEDVGARQELLEGMMGGAFGKKPHVIRVLEDGTVINITNIYKKYLP